MTVPLCSIVIPTFNGRALLEVCLASVKNHSPQDIPIEVVVADDGSTDATEAWLGSRYPEVRVVRLEENKGFCVAANAGIAAARGEFIQLLNNDTEVTPGWIEAGLAPFQDPKVGSVAPLVLVRSDPDRVDSAGDTYSFVGWPCKRGHGEPSRDWFERPTDRVFGASGSSAFYRSSALRKVGGFDAAFGSYYEDIDLAFRLRWAGYDCIFTPKSRILHEVSASYDHAHADLQRRMSRNAETLFWTDLPGPWLAAAIVPHLAFISGQSLRRLLQGRIAPFLLGKLDALRDWHNLAGRRRLRKDLAMAGVSTPHFPINFGLLRDVRNHIGRPREATSLSRLPPPR